MEKYDYRKGVAEDIISFVGKYYSPSKVKEIIRKGDRAFADFMGDVYTKCLMSDEVTGNDSGKYTSHRKANVYIKGNRDLYNKYAEKHGFLKMEDPRWIDTTIRTFILDEVFDSAMCDVVRRYSIEDM